MSLAPSSDPTPGAVDVEVPISWDRSVTVDVASLTWMEALSYLEKKGVDWP